MQQLRDPDASVATISKLQEQYQALSGAVDSNSLASISHVIDGKALISSNIISRLTSVFAVRAKWQRFEEEQKCSHLHARNAANYHQFHHELAACDEGLKLKALSIKRLLTADPNVASVHGAIKTLLEELLCLQSCVDHLVSLSADIVPLPLRCEPLSEPVKAILLLKPESMHEQVKAGEDCLLIDNSHAARWKVKRKNGQVIELPALCVLLPPTDQAAVSAAMRVHKQLATTWKDCMQVIENFGRENFVNFLNKNSASKVGGGDAELIKNTVALVQEVLLTNAPSQAQLLAAQCTDILQQASQTGKGRQRDPNNNSKLSDTAWKSQHGLVQHIKEFSIFAKKYLKKDTVSEQLHHDVTGNQKFESKAYITIYPSEESLRANASSGASVVPRMSTVVEKVPVFTGADGVDGARQKEEEEEEEEWVTQEYEEPEEFSSQTIKETQTFVIVGVMDPRSKEHVSLYRAIADGIVSQSRGIYIDPITGHTMPIPEAMAKGLIMVEYTNKRVVEGDLIKRGILQVHTPHEDLAYSVRSVLDPTTGEKISLTDAVDRGIIDQATGMYVNPKTGLRISIAAAAEKGFLEVDKVDKVDMRRVDNKKVKSAAAVVLEDVFDPKSGKMLSGEEARMRGLVDSTGAFYINPLTKDQIPIEEAIRRGLVKGKLVQGQGQVNDGSVVVEGCVLALERHPSLEALLRNSPPNLSNGQHKSKSPSESILDKLSQQADIDPLAKGVFDPASGKELTIKEAVNQGLLHLDELSMGDGRGARKDLVKATVDGHISPVTAQALIKSLEPHSLDKFLQRDSISSTGGKVDISMNSNAGKYLSAAIKQGDVDPEMVFYADNTSHTIMSVDSAVRTGKWDSQTGQLVDPVKQTCVSLSDAIDEGIVDPHIDHSKVGAELAALLLAKQHDLLQHKLSSDPFTNQTLTVEEAIRTDVLDLPHGQFVDKKTVQRLSIGEAVKRGYLDRAVAKQLLEAMSEQSLGHAIDRGTIDLTTGKAIHPKNKNKIPLKEAFDTGLLNPSGVYFFDTQTQSVASFQSAIEAGKYNVVTGRFLDDKTHLDVGMLTAVNNDIIRPRFTANDILDSSLTVKDVLASSKDATVVLPSGHKLGLTKALELGLLLPSTQLSGDSGSVSLKQHALLIDALLAQQDQLDWLGNIEQQMVQAAVCHADTAALATSFQQHKHIEQQLKAGEDKINATIEDGRRVLQQEIKMNDELFKQLHQKLRVNTSDIKVRHNLDDQELQVRMQRLPELVSRVTHSDASIDDCQQWLVNMRGELHAIGQGCRLEQWRDTAAAVETLGSQLTSKKENIESTAKLARNTISDLKSYQRQLENFQNKLPDTPKKSLNLDSNMEQKVANVSKEYIELVDKCKRMKATVREVDNKLRIFHQLEKELTDGVDGIDQDGTGDIQLMKAQLVTKSHDFQALSKCHTDLAQLIGARPDEVQCDVSGLGQTVQRLGERLEALEERCVARQREQTLATQPENQLDLLMEWVAGHETQQHEQQPVSLADPTLAAQYHAHRLLMADLDSRRDTINDITSQCEAQFPGKTADLLDRYDALVGKSLERGQEMESVRSQLTELNGNMKDIESWLGEAVALLKRHEAEDSAHALGDLAQTLFGQKQEKDEVMEQIKQLAKQLTDMDTTKDKNVLKHRVTDLQGRWHDFAETLVRLYSFAALRDIDDTLQYLDKAENEINTAEPISCDAETVAHQLKEHMAFNDEVTVRRQQVKDTMDRCGQLLREVTSGDVDELSYKLEAIRNQAQVVSELSAARLAALEEALPLASHFTATHDDLQAWLSEIEADIEAIDVMPGATFDQIKKQQDLAKVTQNIVAEHRPLVNQLMVSGGELCDLCVDDDTSAVHDDMILVARKYEQVKVAASGKASLLSSELLASITDPADTVDAIVDELHHLANLADLAEPVAANVSTLREQLVENTGLLTDVEKLAGLISDARTALRRPKVEKSGEEEGGRTEEEVQARLEDAEHMQASLRDDILARGTQLTDAVTVAEKFESEMSDLMHSLRDAKDNLLSQDTPGIEAATVEEQLRELQVIKDDLQEVQAQWVECQQNGELLKTKCGCGGQMDVQKQLEDADMLMTEVVEGIQEREEDLVLALGKAERFEQVMATVLGWLPSMEQRIQTLGPLAADARTLRVQMEELKVLRVQVRACQSDISTMNQCFAQLKSSAPVSAESGQQQVSEVNDRWTAICSGCNDREQALNEATVKLGELETTQDDLIGLLQQTEVDMQSIDIGYSDPALIETNIRVLQDVEKSVNKLSGVVKKLSVAVDEVRKAGGGRQTPVVTRQEELRETYDTVVVLIRNKLNGLHDMLKQVKNFMGNVDDLLRWLSDYRLELKSSAAMGALPDTAQRNYDTFMIRYNELATKEEEVKTILLSGEDMVAQCHENDAKQLTEGLNRLRTRMYDTRNKAERRKRQILEHYQNVSEFHATLSIHTDWLNSAEKVLMSQKGASKLLNTVLQQMEDFKVMKQDIDDHKELMHHLDRTGTYLKYFGRKQDTIYIKNLLMNIKLRWLKLVRRADERQRLLQYAHREDKRFDDAWHSVCNWLDSSESKLRQYVAAGVTATNKVKQDIDELKMFSSLLNSHYPLYHTTLRQGHALKDRCTRTDPERDVLLNMIEELKNKWNVVRSMTSQSQNKLDEALISSGRFADAVQSLLEWLNKSDAYLAEDQPILGDLDTVSSLIEQHREFEQELEGRQAMVKVIRMSPNTDMAVASQLDMLTNLMDRVTQLTDLRSRKLQDALRLAEEFNEVVQQVREYLPQMESELKFKNLPEDEVAIIHLIEQHERFLDDLRSQQANIDKIRFLAEEIMISCHPNAVRFVKYYLTITHTRWEQALARCTQRSQRLQEALRAVRGNSALLEELLAWLSEAQALLVTKEKDIMSDDLTVVEALLKEHLDYHEELTNKNREVERLTKSGETGTPSTRASTLHTRWRNVWRMSVDRKKKLQDVFEHLLELESFKSFDFIVWRERYMAWIRSKKLRITDFFRKQDKDGDGVLSRSEFIDGMMMSKFPTNRTELNAVFDIFDKSNSGMLDYSEFIDALRPDRTRSKTKPQRESELVHDEVEQQVAKCQCRRQLKVNKISDGKYKFGDKEKVCLVRFLNNTVMVRVGGGWVTLSEFLDLNDPCRAKGRLNLDLREQLREPHTTARISSVTRPAGTGSAVSATTPMSAGTARRKSLASTPTSQGQQVTGSGVSSRSPTVQRKSLTPSKTTTAAIATAAAKAALTKPPASIKPAAAKLSIATSDQSRSRSRSPAGRSTPSNDSSRKMSMTPKSSRI